MNFSTTRTAKLVKRLRSRTDGRDLYSDRLRFEDLSCDAVQDAKTVVWNATDGDAFEGCRKFSGTEAVAKALQILKLPTIIGGHSAAAV